MMYFTPSVVFTLATLLPPMEAGASWARRFTISFFETGWESRLIDAGVECWPSLF